MRPVLPWLAVILLAPSVSPRAQEQGVQFSTSSSLVVMSVRVTDRRGDHVGGLDASAFAVFEDGRRQTIGAFATEDTPVTVGLIVDSSISMWPIRDRVIAAAAAFAQASHPSDELFAIAFNEHHWPALPLSAPFTSDGRVLRDALAAAVQPRGRTGLFDAIAAGLQYADRGRHTRKILLVISDGGDNASTRTFEGTIASTQASNTVIYGVALVDPLNGDAKPDVLKRLARSTGGETLTPRTADELERALVHIARDIRHSYTLGYMPAGPADGRFHRLRVAVSSPEQRQLNVRTREGYRDGLARTGSANGSK
jgi:Ca-activated chloride channel family protein